MPTARNKIKMQMYQPYFLLPINQRINERQKRNALNINHLFNTVISDCNHSKYQTENPQVNNGIYHHIGRNHSKYPLNTPTA
jgi:hypothetical protein